MTGKTITLEDLKGILRARITESTSMRAVSRALGISAATLSSLLLHHGRKPGPKLLSALGYERLEMYRRVK